MYMHNVWSLDITHKVKNTLGSVMNYNYILEEQAKGSN